MQQQFRNEKDSLGEVLIPESRLYGTQTQRAVNNFSISGLRMPFEFIHAVALIKKLAAQVNMDLGLLDPKIGSSIMLAATQIIEGEFTDHFPVDVFQTGSGTSTNMNVNEVIATLAGRDCKLKVNPNDHVNLGQSSNDVIPTAIHLSCALLSHRHLLPALVLLAETLEQKALALQGVIKTGRTHLMDAMPLSMGKELGAWALQIRNGIDRLMSVLTRVYKIAQGGTAVGTGINAHSEFAVRFALKLGTETGIPFQPNESFFESLSSQDTAVELSGQLKVIAVSLMKIANDLRWMNSGPLSGLGEIKLPPLQAGSSIMPGKVNPVVPESVAMVAAQVIGNDATITIAGQSGNFQLNVMLPIIAYNLLQSIQILGNASRALAEKAIKNFTVNTDSIEIALARNPILVTALNPLVGYAKATEIAKAAYAQGRAIIDVAEEMTDFSREELERLLNPKKLAKD